MDMKDAMIRIYADLVKNGSRTLDSLPDEYKESVKKYMEDHNIRF